MTVMIDRFFGVHPDVLRNGTWARLRPSAQSLYIVVMHESERRSSHAVRCTDARLLELGGIAPRSACDARKQCKEEGILAYRRTDGNVYEYTILDPTTRSPYAVSTPKIRAKYVRLADRANDLVEIERIDAKPVAVRGLAGVFGE